MTIQKVPDIDFKWFVLAELPELFENNRKANFFAIIFYPMGKFLSNYFIKQGFRDGGEGFVHATLMSFHSFLVRGKLFLIWQRKQAS